MINGGQFISFSKPVFPTERRLFVIFLFFYSFAMENKSGSGNLHSDKKSKRGEKKEVDTFYTRVYDDVIQKNTPVDNMIIE